ncbi:MAG: biopolymer transporter ExbD [Gemmatimonadetes bacterium]|nr:biopolymer transporter ExbD [Gemmatimonadota bacterium]
MAAGKRKNLTKRPGVSTSQLPKIAGMEGAQVNADINMTPMIDVMLVLLIIFMVITPALAGYVVTLPKAAQAQPERDDRVTMGIDADGKFYLDQTPGVIPEASLVGVLRQAYSVRPDDHVLYIKADQDVRFGSFLTVVAAAREAGVARIGAITEMSTDLMPVATRR